MFLVFPFSLYSLSIWVFSDDSNFLVVVVLKFQILVVFNYYFVVFNKICTETCILVLLLIVI